MSIFAWVVLGLLIGAIFGWLTGGRGRDLLGSSVASMLGAILGGFLASVLLGLDVAGFDVTSLAVAGLGGLALFAFERAIPAVDVYE
jgi:uncharacterized membrane protein YeaQ/YmgE (transglycosylase-associated protein family)